MHVFISNRWKLIAILSLISVVAGAVLVFNSYYKSVPANRVQLPPSLTRTDTVTWLGANQLLVGNSEVFWYQSTPGGHWQLLPLPPDPQCLRVYYHNVLLLADGRLGMIKMCTGHIDPSTGFDFTASLIAYDWQTHQVNPLIPRKLPNTGEFTWNTALQRGVFTPIGNYSTLYWLLPGGVEPVPILLRKGLRSWYLPDTITALAKYQAAPGQVGRQPKQIGMARDPAWSPTEDKIAFWATLETIGQSDAFPVVPWDIYLLNPNTLTTERLLSDVMDPARLVWSPNGRWLAYCSGSDWRKPRGIWLFSLDQRRSLLVQRGHFFDLAWSPDGNTLAATQCFDATCSQSAVWTYDIRGLVQ